MAKRSKSKRKASKKRRSTPVAAAASVQPEPARRADLETEYKYVAEDLKRIGIIAAVLVTVLVVLSFFL